MVVDTLHGTDFHALAIIQYPGASRRGHIFFSVTPNVDADVFIASERCQQR